MRFTSAFWRPRLVQAGLRPESSLLGGLGTAFHLLHQVKRGHVSRSRESGS